MKKSTILLRSVCFDKATNFKKFIINEGESGVIKKNSETFDESPLLDKKFNHVFRKMKISGETNKNKHLMTMIEYDKEKYFF